MDLMLFALSPFSEEYPYNSYYELRIVLQPYNILEGIRNPSKTCHGYSFTRNVFGIPIFHHNHRAVQPGSTWSTKARKLVDEILRHLPE